MPAALTDKTAHELTLKEVSHDAVIALAIILRPPLRLFSHRKPTNFDLLILGLGSDPIQLVVHPVNQKPQKLLSILLPVPTELAHSATHLVFQLLRRHCHPLRLSHFCEQVRERITQRCLPKLRLRNESFEHVFIEVGRSQHTLQDRVHKARVADVSQPTRHMKTRAHHLCGGGGAQRFRQW